MSATASLFDTNTPQGPAPSSEGLQATRSRATAIAGPALLEQRRRECEARHYLRMPGPERVAALRRIAQRRGEVAAEMLADDIRALREKGAA